MGRAALGLSFQANMWGTLAEGAPDPLGVLERSPQAGASTISAITLFVIEYICIFVLELTAQLQLNTKLLASLQSLDLNALTLPK